MERMKSPNPQQRLRLLYRVKPTAGALGALCEENYRLLKRLASGLDGMQGRFLSQIPHHPPLLMEITREGPFTRLVRLTHLFRVIEDGPMRPDPDLTMKIYSDTGQIEVLEIKNQQRLPLQGLYRTPGLQQKWQANLFLGNWLTYCYKKGYVFNKGAEDLSGDPIPESLEIA
jgi:uncharacterized protein YqiB (DUF1249 family)